MTGNDGGERAPMARLARQITTAIAAEGAGVVAHALMDAADEETLMLLLSAIGCELIAKKEREEGGARLRAV